MAHITHAWLCIYGDRVEKLGAIGIFEPTLMFCNVDRFLYIPILIIMMTKSVYLYSFISIVLMKLSRGNIGVY